MPFLDLGCCRHAAAVLSSCLCRQAVVCSAEQERTRVGVWSCRGPPECALLFGSRTVGNGSSAFLSFSKQGVYFWKGCGLSESREAGKSAGKEQDKWFARAHQVLASWSLSVCVQQLSVGKCACWERGQHPPGPREKGRWLMGCVGLLQAGPWPPRDSFVSCSSEKSTKGLSGR